MNIEKKLEVGMVFKYPNDRICNSIFLDMENNISQVGFLHPQNGIEQSNDFDRKSYLYIVEHVEYEEMQKTYTYSTEIIPKIFARKLSNNGDYDPNGELIIFYSSYTAENYLSMYTIEIVKVMRQVVTFVDEIDSDLIDLIKNEKEEKEKTPTVEV